MLHVEERARESGFSRKPHFAFSHCGSIAKGISECPDLPLQSPFNFALALLNLAAGFLFAA
jgi:hypothetical protein